MNEVEASTNVAAVVLAAGKASRFGAQKLLASIDGIPLVRWVALAATHSLASQVIVVVAPRDADPITAALEGLPLDVVLNERAEEGMSTSMQRALDSVDETAAAALVLLGDQPSIGVSVVNAILAEYSRTRAPIVQPLYRGDPGHPVLFDRSLFDELRALDGDRGGRDVIARDPARVLHVSIDAEPLRDVDTPADLDLMRP